MASFIFVDGVKFFPAPVQPLTQPPVIGCRDYVQEIQRFDLYNTKIEPFQSLTCLGRFMTEAAFDYVKSLPYSTFKASNGYAIVCLDSPSSLSDTVLQLHANTFRGCRVELNDFFTSKKPQTLTKEIASKIKFAMQELGPLVVDRLNVTWSNLEKY